MRTRVSVTFATDPVKIPHTLCMGLQQQQGVFGRTMALTPADLEAGGTFGDGNGRGTVEVAEACATQQIMVKCFGVLLTY